MINDRNDSPSNREITGDLIWNYNLNEKGWSMYLDGKNGTDDVSPYAAPAPEQIFQIFHIHTRASGN